MIKQDAFNDFTKIDFNEWAESGFQQAKGLLEVKKNEEWGVKATGRIGTGGTEAKGEFYDERTVMLI